MSKGNPIQLATADHIVKLWTAKWQELTPNARTVVCGSIRRRERMVRDIDILVIDVEMHGTFQRGAKFEGVELNLCFVKPECLGAGMLFLTGDHAFNIRLRSVAKGKGLKLNRYGLWKGDDCIASETEEDIFKALDLPFTSPENRKSPNGQKGIIIHSNSAPGDAYEVFITEVHGFNFCECRGYQYRQSCKHLETASQHG